MKKLYNSKEKMIKKCLNAYGDSCFIEKLEIFYKKLYLQMKEINKKYFQIKFINGISMLCKMDANLQVIK